jgi:cation:H+ antiporter
MHVLLIVISLLVMWFASGLLISGIERFSRGSGITRFGVSFLLLGFLTSVTDISIGINSIIQKTPGIFVGDLIGGSFVLLTLVIPLLAIFNKGIRLNQHLQPKRLLEFLLIITAPVVIIYDGSVNLYEAFLLIFLYIVFSYSLESEESIRQHLTVHASSKTSSKKLSSLVHIILGAILVFIASHLVIQQVIYFSALWKVSTFMLSLLVFSIGSNLPELFIALRAIRRREVDIAFGDYIGSAAANTILFGIFTFLNGPFLLDTTNFTTASLVMLLGYALFFIFARSKNTISVYEGLLLMFVFLAFMFLQIFQIISLAGI